MTTRIVINPTTSRDPGERARIEVDGLAAVGVDVDQAALGDPCIVMELGEVAVLLDVTQARVLAQQLDEACAAFDAGVEEGRERSVVAW